MHKILTMVLLLTTSLAFAADPAVEEKLVAQVKNVLGDSTKVDSVIETPIPGLYEIFINGSKIVYMSEDSRYVIEGDLMDLKNRQNLTEERRGQGRSVGFKNADVNKMIEFAPEKTEHVLYVYTDIDCAYCRKFHNQVSQLNDNGIAVRYLAFPRAGIGSPAYDAAESAWCAADSKQALTAAKAGQTIPTAQCDDRVKEQYNLGRSMGVRGTPAVYLANGREMGGYIPAKELISFFRGGL